MIFRAAGFAHPFAVQPASAARLSEGVALQERGTKVDPQLRMTESEDPDCTSEQWFSS
jgi:hypothetical protein